jgi:glycogen(starch) synthase
VKVLMLSWEYPPHSVGGLGKHVAELIPALAAAGVEVHLVTPRRAGGAPEEPIADVAGPAAGPNRQSRVYRVEPPSGDAPSFVVGAERTNATLEQRARQLWDSEGPFDVVHAHDWLVAYAGVALKHAFKVPLLATIHATEYGRCRGVIQSEMSRAINHVEWWLTYEAWRVITCSHYMAREVQTALGVPPDKVDVVPNGVDPRRFDQLDGEDLTAFRQRFAALDERIVFYVGRVVYEKGVHLLVEAMPRILAHNPQVKLVVAGTGDSLNSVRRRALELGIGSRCYFAGFIPDEVRDRLFRVADVAAFPSLYEPFGIVALEAMAARTPVVAADVGGMSEVVRHAETAVTVYPNDVDSLAWGILHTLDRPDWARARAANAYQTVRDEYNWGIVARQTNAVYTQIVTERRQVIWL